MKRSALLLVLFVIISSVAWGENELTGVIDYKIRESDYEPYDYDGKTGKLNLVIEVDLINGRLPNKLELKAVSNDALKGKENAHMKWIFFLLPKMKTGSGSFATDHRIPKAEGIKMPDYMLLGTPYAYLIE